MGFQFEQHRLGLWDLSWDLKKKQFPGKWEQDPPSRPSFVTVEAVVTVGDLVKLEGVVTVGEGVVTVEDVVIVEDVVTIEDVVPVEDVVTGS